MVTLETSLEYKKNNNKKRETMRVILIYYFQLLTNFCLTFLAELKLISADDLPNTQMIFEQKVIDQYVKELLANEKNDMDSNAFFEKNYMQLSNDAFIREQLKKTHKRLEKSNATGGRS